MVELQHSAEPADLSDYRRRHPNGSWKDPAFQTVRAVVRRQLNREQAGLCAYCERLLAQDDGHVDHIKAQDLEPGLSLSYENLVHSCDGPSHCGHEKGNDPLSVEPRPGCNRFFALMALDGKLAPAVALTPPEAQRASHTLALLGLNVPALARQRKGFVDVIRYLSDSSLIAEFIAGSPFRWPLRGL